MTDTAEIETIQQRVDRLEAEVDRLRQQLTAQAAGPTLSADAGAGDPSQRLTLQQATGVASQLMARPISPSTLRRWCIEHRIGWRLPSSTWVVSKGRLERFVLGGDR